MIKTSTDCADLIRIELRMDYTQQSYLPGQGALLQITTLITWKFGMAD